MRLSQRNLKKFELYKPDRQTDSANDPINVYDKPCAEFMGNLQPYSEDRAFKDYGIDLRYAYIVFTQDDADFQELDRIGSGRPQYEIKVIQQWNSYKRLLVEEVFL